MRRQFYMLCSLLLVGSLSACSGSGVSSLPSGAQLGSNATATQLGSNTNANVSSTRQAQSTSVYTYTAPWGNLSNAETAILNPQGNCGHIPVTRTSGFVWPSFLNTLASSTTVTVTGVPSYNDSWSKSNGCPTGGIVVSEIALGNASPSPTASQSPVPSTKPSGYVYTAPWNGFGSTATAILNPQGSCAHIPVTQAAGFKWPAFLSTLPTGTALKISGTPSYADAWSQTNGCPTGGLVATSIVAGNGTPSPSPNPTIVPSPKASPLQSGSTLSSLFTGNTPFHHKVSTLQAYGATVLSSAIATNFWGQGPSQEWLSNGIPIYRVSSGDPSYSFSCNAYGTCVVAGRTVHYPSGATPQCARGLHNCNYDYHINSSDTVYNHGEFGGWECKNASNLGTCGWGSFYPYSSSGLSQDVGSVWDGVNAGGYAFGLFQLTANDLNQTSINHALGIVFGCGNPGNYVYPSTSPKTFVSGQVCSGGGGRALPTVTYGDLVAIKPSVNIANLGGSPECQKILTAMQAYGAYPMDTNGNYGLTISTDMYGQYGSPNPWDSHISSMNAAGDGTGTGNDFLSYFCLNRIPTSDIEVLQLNQGGTSTLPSVNTL
jgi:hypothetical protein